MSTHYPSHTEIQAIVGPRIAKLCQKTLYAEYRAPASAPIRYLEVVGDRNSWESSNRQPRYHKDNLLAESVHLLRDIRDFEDGLKARFDRLKWGPEKGNQRLRELRDAGYVAITVARSSNPKGGRARHVATITPKGREFLEAFERVNEPHE